MGHGCNHQCTGQFLSVIFQLVVLFYQYYFMVNNAIWVWMRQRRCAQLDTEGNFLPRDGSKETFWQSDGQYLSKKLYNCINLPIKGYHVSYLAQPSYSQEQALTISPQIKCNSRAVGKFKMLCLRHMSWISHYDNQVDQYSWKTKKSEHMKCDNLLLPQELIDADFPSIHQLCALQDKDYQQ